MAPFRLLLVFSLFLFSFLVLPVGTFQISWTHHVTHHMTHHMTHHVTHQVICQVTDEVTCDSSGDSSRGHMARVHQAGSNFVLQQVAHV